MNTAPGVTTVAALTSDGGYRISPTVRYRTSALSQRGIGHHSVPGGVLEVQCGAVLVGVTLPEGCPLTASLRAPPTLYEPVVCTEM